MEQGLLFSSLLPVKFFCKVSIEIFDLDSFLLHGITITDSYRTIVFGLEIVGNTESGTDLILSTVTISDDSTDIKLTVISLSELCVYFLCTLV